MVKETQVKIERELTEWKKIFVLNTSDEVLISRIHKG